MHVAAAPEHPTRTSAPPRRLTTDDCAACSGRPRDPGQPSAVGWCNVGQSFSSAEESAPQNRVILPPFAEHPDSERQARPDMRGPARCVSFSSYCSGPYHVCVRLHWLVPAGDGVSWLGDCSLEGQRRLEMWTPTEDFVVVTSMKDRRRSPAGGGPIEQWPHRIGRHEAAAEFPVMLVRQFLLEQGYKVFVSGLSEKVSIDSYSLAMFPGKRQDSAFANAKNVLGLDERGARRLLASGESAWVRAAWARMAGTRTCWFNIRVGRPSAVLLK